MQKVDHGHNVEILDEGEVSSFSVRALKGNKAAKTRLEEKRQALIMSVGPPCLAGAPKAPPYCHSRPVQISPQQGPC